MEQEEREIELTISDDRQEDYRLSDEEKRAYFAPIYKRGDTILLIALLTFAAFAGILSTVGKTFVVTTAVVGISLALYALFRIAMPKHHAFRYIGSTALAAMAGLMLFQTNSVPQIHFVALVGIALLIVYQDWRIQLPFAALVLLINLVFAYLEVQDVEGIYFSGTNGFSLQRFAVHILLEGTALAVCTFWGHRFRLRSTEMFRHHAFSERQINTIDRSIGFANEMAQGNLESEFEAEKDDDLSTALVDMRASLLEAREKERKEKFINVGLAEVGEILRDFDNDFEQIASRLISKLVNYFGANQGGLFLIEKDSEDAKPHLELIAFYAYQRLKYSDRRVNYGEGLLGQALQEEETIYLEVVPKGYITTTSGLGEATPKSLLIVPLKVNDVVHGMLEMASFKPFEEHQIELMKKLGESIASTISNYKTTNYTKRLLEESQSLSEQMRSQEEEMRQNMEELQATQEEVSRKESMLAQELDRLKAEHFEEVTKLKEELKQAKEQEG